MTRLALALLALLAGCSVSHAPRDGGSADRECYATDVLNPGCTLDEVRNLWVCHCDVAI